MSEEIVLIDTVIQLEQLIYGHRVWWGNGCWRCACPDWSSCDCSHTLQAGSSVHNHQPTSPVSSSSPGPRMSASPAQILH
jgi:hypothetical protein